MNSQTKCNNKEIRIANKKCMISFDMEEQSSDGGWLFISKIDEKLKITKTLSELMDEKRDERYVKHDQRTLFLQRLYGIIQGYEDCNDHDELRNDPLLKLIAGKEDNDTLASQPTLCRFENDYYNDEKSARIKRIEEYLIEHYVSSLTRENRSSITLDIDTTDAQTYGAQQLTFFHGYYGTYMYYPILVYDYPSGGLAGAMLRPGNANGYEGSVELIERIIRKLKARFPRCRIKVRGDCAFGVPAMMDKLEELDRTVGKVWYELGLKGNSVLNKKSEKALNRTISIYKDQTHSNDTVRRYHSTKYRAQSWPKARRVIYKTEAGANGNQVRYVVVNYRKGPGETYQSYCQRGQMENWVGDFKNSLHGDRMSCSYWFANQFRFLLYCFAYVLMHELRILLFGTKYHVMRLWNICLKLLKVSISIKRTARCIRLRISRSFPYQAVWDKLLEQLA